MYEMKTNSMNGDQMKDARKYLRLTQEELGEIIGMSRVMIGLMERGEKSIGNRTELAVRYLVLDSAF